MVTRPKPRHRKTAAELLAASNLGSRGRFLNENEAVELLRQAVELEGSQYAFAKRHAVDRTHLIYVLKGERGLSDKFLKILGLREVYAADPQ